MSDDDEAEAGEAVAAWLIIMVIVGFVAPLLIVLWRWALS